MRSVATIKAKTILLDLPLSNYLNQFQRFDLKLIWKEYDYTFLYDKYKVILSGKKEDIEDFYSFLKMNNIHVYEK